MDATLGAKGDSLVLGTAFAFSRPESALRLGHVAWGYTSAAGGTTLYSFGSVEDSRAYPVAPPGKMEFWQESAPASSLGSLVAILRGLHYSHFKAWPVPGADPEAAAAAAALQSHRPYVIVRNNCLDTVHHILTAYGATDFHLGDLRHPRSWIPNAWFGSIPEPSRDLDRLMATVADPRRAQPVARTG